MNRLFAWAAMLVALVVAAPAQAASDAASARAFVEKLYSHYPQPSNGPYFSPTDKNAKEVFDPGMIAAFREDSRLANGEVGFVDADPICQCQDDSGLKPKVLSVTMKGPTAADVLVSLGFENEKPRPMTIHLMVVNGAWRIHDLSTPDSKSYLADLLKANKEAAAAAHHR